LARYTLFGVKGVREFKLGGLQPVSPVAIESLSPTSLLMNGFMQSSLTDTLLKCVSNAKSSVYLCTYTFDANSALFPMLRKLASTGVDVRLMLNNNIKNKLLMEALQQVGVKVLLIDRMHAKAVIVDDLSGVVSTTNFCNSGLNDGINIGVRFSLETPNRLELIKRFFLERL
jgi:phosphatidylserine/phosphatidylglycerophosphate/cardiolipin synthase-like enzyme